MDEPGRSGTARTCSCTASSWTSRSSSGPNTLDYRFKVQNGDYSVLATYTGVVPDTFKDGAEVVLTGRLGPDGFQGRPRRDGEVPVEVRSGGATAVAPITPLARET